MKLIRIIQTMSKSEKRFFKLHNNAIGKKNKTSNLIFDLINKDSNLDTKILQYKIDTKYYPIAKSVLYEKILDSLLIYNKEDKSVSKLNKELSKINILFERNLLKDSLNKIKKTLKNESAQLDKKDLLQVYLLYQKILIKQRLLDRKYTPELLELNTKIIALYDYLSQLSVYEDVIIDIGYKQTQGTLSIEQTNKQIKAIIEKISHIKKENIHPDLVATHYGILSRYYTIIEENELCLKIMKEVIPYIKKNKNYVIDKDYIYIMSGYLYSCLSLNEMSTFKENYTDTLSYFSEALGKRFVSIFIRYVEAVVLSDFPDWELKEIQRIEQYVIDYQNQLHFNNVSYIQYRLAEIYFLIEDFDKTIVCLELVINNKANKMLAPFHPEGLYLLIFSYLEIDESSLALRYINSLRYYIRSPNNINSIKPDILNLLRQIYNNWDEKNRFNIFKKIYELYQKRDFKEKLHSNVLEKYALKRSVN